ncbi:MAG: carboxypeptidase-like regulatory domain-containing protein [Flavobacteriaceae bacterium]|nr:MAG: carboxypeptidase-like regulatory domain-containing protein [Flavobacteriaceae bacterium]
MKKLIVLLFLFVSITGFTQIKGTITNTKGAPLSFVSVYLDKTITGTTSNDHGNYELNISKTGTYTVIFQLLGYTVLKKEVAVTSFPFILNVSLEEEEIVLNEIAISAGDNPAIRIIRSAIESKEKNTDAYRQYTAGFYSRGLFKVKNAPEKILGQSLGDLGGGLDSTRTGIIYLSETISEIAYQKRPKKFKEKIIASKVSGSDNGISFNRAEEAHFNFYDNSVSVADSHLVSPIANGAFGYYRYRLEGSFYDKNARLINKVKVTPKREGDRVFSGFIYIVEDDWAIYGVDLISTGKQIGIPIIDELTFKQDYNYSEGNKAWVLITQTIDFRFGIFGFNVDGRFSSAYSDYNFTPGFVEETFTNQILSFEEHATEKDTTFWNRLRPVPLTGEEIKDYILKDSIKVVRKSKKYLDSIDQKNNKFSFLSPFTGYTYRNRYRKWSVTLNSPLENIAYNTVQGWNTSVGFNYFKRLNNKGKWISMGADASYGLSEKKLRPVFYFGKKWNNIERPRFSVSGGITTSQFNARNPISRLHNTLYSLLAKENYLKIYEKTFTRVSYSQEAVNGVFLSTSLEYANRKPLFNTTNYVLFGRDIPFQSNNPTDPTNFSAPFVSHTIWSFNLGATIVFGQKYLMYPNRKFNVGNTKYPSLHIGYRKNFGGDNNSTYGSDLFMARLHQFISLGNEGDFRYHIRSGFFLKQKEIPFMDYLHADGNRLDLAPSNYINSFGLLDYYRFSTNDKYAEWHVEHNFRGFLLSRVPLINTLNFHLVVGAKGLFTGGRKPYTEYTIGLDNIGFGKWRFLRIDYVRSNFNSVKNDGFLFGISF